MVTQTPIAGWAVATDGGETVALEITITAELRREGLAREFIRLVQDARKSDGFAVSDRVSVRWSTADPELVAALTGHQALISAEVLAVDFGPAGDLGPVDDLAPAGDLGPVDDLGPAGDRADAAHAAGSQARRHESSELGLTFWLEVR